MFVLSKTVLCAFSSDFYLCLVKDFYLCLVLGKGNKSAKANFSLVYVIHSEINVLKI